jgi:hypothetical protein
VATRPIKIATVGDDSNLKKPSSAFYAPQPYGSWALDENYVWQPPTPMPDDGPLYEWDEPTTSWVEITE